MFLFSFLLFWVDTKHYVFSSKAFFLSFRTTVWNDDGLSKFSCISNWHFFTSLRVNNDQKRWILQRSCVVEMNSIPRFDWHWPWRYWNFDKSWNWFCTRRTFSYHLHDVFVDVWPIHITKSRGTHANNRWMPSMQLLENFVLLWNRHYNYFVKI